MDVTAITALAASAAALLTSVFSVVKWRQERRKAVGDWQVQFLHELVLQRLATYPPLLKTLSAVRYYGEGFPVELDSDRLPTVADELLTHLYGEAGLVMSPATRACVHRAWMASRDHRRGRSGETELINAFFEARHSLRADIQIADSPSFDTALNEMSRQQAGSRVAPAAQPRAKA